ncbi:MAG: hypothetical protein ABL997_12140 [Planctomycetota bacterium]
MIPIPSLTSLAACLALLSAGLVVFGVDTEDNTKPADTGSVRCRLADQDAEPLLQWVVARYQTPSFLDAEGRTFTAAVLGDRKEEAWFDDAGLSLLQAGHEVHHVRRIGQGSTAGVHDVLYLSTGASAVEHLTAVEPTAPTRFADALAFRDLVTENQRPAVELALREYGIRPGQLERTLRLDRKRHGILLSDQRGACIEITVDQCMSRQHDLALRWVEFEVSIVPLRHADPLARTELHEVRDRIVEEALAQSPRLKLDQESPYAAVFLRLQSSTWLPLRTLHELRVSDMEAKISLLVLAAFMLGAPSAVLALRRARSAASERRLRTV